MKTKSKILVFTFLLAMGLISSCQYDNIIEPVTPPPNPTDTVSFVNQIEPIFNNNSNCTACHFTGGGHSDLTTGNAYNSIKSMGLVNLSDPEASIIYWYPNLDNSSDHTWKKYTAEEAQLVLQWIKQGALNN